MSEWNPNLPEVSVPTKRRRRKAKSQQKKRGRPKKIRTFKETTFGRSLMLHAPLEYDMIMETTGDRAPEADFVETVSYSSANPYFQTKIFHRLLLQYRRNGCTQLRPVSKPTPEMIRRALEQRRKNMYGF